MREVTDYQFAYFNNIIYNEQEPQGPVSDFTTFSESGRLESGLAATACIREDQVVYFSVLGSICRKAVRGSSVLPDLVVHMHA